VTDTIDADASPLFALAADLDGVADVFARKLGQAVQQTGIKTKKFWADDARKKAGKRTRRYGASIDYTMTRSTAFGIVHVQAEIGPNLARYGGKSGKGGLQPSLGVLELAPGGIKAAPRESIRRAFAFAEQELQVGVEIAIRQTQEAHGL
jgi:hypothetical protein